KERGRTGVFWGGRKAKRWWEREKQNDDEKTPLEKKSREGQFSHQKRQKSPRFFHVSLLGLQNFFHPLERFQ
ncbi:hypothetical protein ACQ1Z4_14565, partial [Enterococcus faecalis]|uniref:hypothetical protein n=1 Tax=Enterococcus faecalis TaxID=1351 RepID=UPI003D6A5572